MELQPVYQAVHSLLDQDMIRLLTDLAEHPRATGGTGTVSAALDRKLNRKRSELFNIAWARCEAFLRIAQPAYRARTGLQKEMTMPGLLGPAFRERLSAAMRIPVVEMLFPVPWTAAARRVLPSPSPQMTATAMWAPIIAWCALETLAESIDSQKPEQVALDAFDRLRLRQPLAESFNHLGFEDEAGWRAAARIKIVLLTETKTGVPATEQGTATSAGSPGSEPKHPEATVPAPPPEPETKAMPPAVQVHNVSGLHHDLWSDPDVRWLTGVHDAGAHTYLVREPYEELLWWLQMPALLNIAGQPSPSKAEVRALSKRVQDLLMAAEKAGYRLQSMLGEDASKPDAEKEEEHAAKKQDSQTEENRSSLDQNSTKHSKSKEDAPIESKK
jgi:hypothetical protein